MTITVENIRAVSGGEEAEITLAIRSGEESQIIKGSVSAAQLAELHFASRLGMCFEIDRMTCDAVLRSMKLQSAIKKGASLLGFSRNTKRALKNKLIRKGYPADISEEAVIYLAEHGYIREENDAVLLAETLANRRHYGKNRIKKELFAKGFESDIIRETMEEMDVDFAEICMKRIETMGGVEIFSEAESKKKAMAALMRYGFSYEDMKEALAVLKEER